jgi:hypothetical protein
MSEALPIKKRQFWQLHLSTIVILVLVFGLLIPFFAYGFPSYFHAGTIVVIYYGVPYPFFKKWLATGNEEWNWINLGKDAFIGIMLLCAIGYICEWRNRRGA